jgi:hypothetical protein
MWPVIASIGMGLLANSEQRKANSQAADQTAQANAANNALRNQAMPYALENLKTNAELQKFYQQNPFNDQQKAGYQNSNNLIDSFNQGSGQGLLGMANQMMSNGYQRGGSTLAPNQQGLLSTAGPFQMPKMQSFGQIDWEKQNPFSNQNTAAKRASEAVGAAAPMTAMIGQSQDPVWEQVLTDWNKEHMAKFGVGLHDTWSDYADPDGTMEAIRQRYVKAMGG